jgi:hypothetical protein
MNNEDFRSLAGRHALDALKALATLAVDPAAAARDREHARRMVELRLDQASNDISPIFGGRLRTCCTDIANSSRARANYRCASSVPPDCGAEVTITIVLLLLVAGVQRRIDEVGARILERAEVDVL